MLRSVVTAFCGSMPRRLGVTTSGGPEEAMTSTVRSLYSQAPGAGDCSRTTLFGSDADRYLTCIVSPARFASAFAAGAVRPTRLGTARPAAPTCARADVPRMVGTEIGRAHV